MIKTLCFVFITCCFAQRFEYSIKDTYIKQANIVSADYIKPNLKHDKHLTANERATLLRLDVLLTEVINKRHPQSKTVQIIQISNKYVALNKKRNEEMSKLLDELKQITDRN